MIIKYSIPAMIIVGAISCNAVASDLTNRSNKFRNELAVGYQYGFNDDYNVALEVFGQKNPGENRVSYYNLEETTPIDTNEIWGLNDGRADLDWATGVRLRPGYNVTKNTRLFLDGGVVWGDFSMELTDNSNSVGTAQFNDAMVQSDTLRGFRYGAGIEHHLHNINHLSLVLDYSMTEFESVSSNGNNTSNMATMTADDFDSTDALDAPAYQQVMLSVKAEFDPGFRF